MYTFGVRSCRNIAVTITIFPLASVIFGATCANWPSSSIANMTSAGMEGHTLFHLLMPCSFFYLDLWHASSSLGLVLRVLHRRAAAPKQALQVKGAPQQFWQSTLYACLHYSTGVKRSNVFRVFLFDDHMNAEECRRIWTWSTNRKSKPSMEFSDNRVLASSGSVRRQIDSEWFRSITWDAFHHLYHLYHLSSHLSSVAIASGCGDRLVTRSLGVVDRFLWAPYLTSASSNSAEHFSISAARRTSNALRVTERFFQINKRFHIAFMVDAVRFILDDDSIWLQAMIKVWWIIDESIVFPFSAASEDFRRLGMRLASIIFTLLRRTVLQVVVNQATSATNRTGEGRPQSKKHTHTETEWLMVKDMKET